MVLRIQAGLDSANAECLTASAESSRLRADLAKCQASAMDDKLLGRVASLKLQLVEKLVAARSSKKKFVAVAVVAMGFLFRVYLPERLAVHFDRALAALLSFGRRVAM